MNQRLKKQHFEYLERKEEIANDIDKASDIFVDSTKEALTVKEMKNIASTIAGGIREFLEEIPENDKENLILFGAVLTCHEILSALRRSKDFAIDFKKEPEPEYIGDTELYLEQSEKNRKKNQEYEKKGFYTINFKEGGNIVDKIGITLMS